MAIYKISAEHAFDILVWRSQETNTKLRKLVQQVIRDFTTALDVARQSCGSGPTTCCSPHTNAPTVT